MIGFYLTMGKYDGVVIVECPSDDVEAVLTISAGSKGYIRTETMKAFPEDEFRNILAKVT